MPIVCTIGGVDYSQYLKGLAVTPGGDGQVGSATLTLDVVAGGLTIVPMMDVKVWQTYNSAGAGIAQRGRLFGGHINSRTTSNFGNTKTWQINCWDYNIILDKLVRDIWWAGSSTPIVLTAGTFSAQIISLFDQLQKNGTASYPPTVIDSSTGVAFGTAMPAVTYPGGHKASWYVQQLCNTLQSIATAVRPHFYMGTQTTFGVTDNFGTPVIWIYDGALSPSAVVDYSDTPVGAQKGYYGVFRRVDDSSVLTQRIQSIYNTGVLTSYDPTSQGTYPSPYINHGGTGNSGYWMDEAIKDTGSNSSPEAQAALDRLIAAKANPKETFTFDTYERVMPGEYVNITNSLEGLSAQKYRVTQVRMTIEPPETIVSQLTIGNRRLLLFDNGEEEVAGVPIEGDDIPPLAPASFALTSNVWNSGTNLADMVFAIGASPSPDAAGYIVGGTINGSTLYSEDVGSSLTPLLSFAPGISYSLSVQAYDRTGNLSPFTTPPLTGTTASRPAAPSPPTLGTITDSINAVQQYAINVPVNHAALTNNLGGWVKVHAPRGLDHLVAIPAGAPWPTTVTITVPNLTGGIAYDVSAQVTDQYDQSSAFCTPVSHTCGAPQPPLTDPPATGYSGQHPDDDQTIAGWTPISPATLADFAADGTTTSDDGQYSLKMILPATSLIKKQIEGFDIAVRGGQVWSLGITAKVDVALSGPTCAAYARFYNQDRSAQVGTDQTILSITPGTSFNALSKVQITAPAGAKRMTIVLIGTMPLSPVGARNIWWSFPYIEKVKESADLAPASVTAGKIAAGGVSATNQIAAGIVDGTNLASNVLPDALGSGGIVTSVQVQNTITETTLATFTIPANKLVAGRPFLVRGLGSYGATATGVCTLRIKVNGGLLFSFATALASVTSAPWRLELDATCRTTGASGTIWKFANAVLNNVNSDQTGAATSVVDTTATITITITAQWNIASTTNTISIDQGALTYEW